MFRRLLLAATLAPTFANGCEVALALTVDVSGSINQEEYRLQMDGLADALMDGAISEALVRAQAKLAVMQWSGASRQDITIPWMQMATQADVQALSDLVRSSPRPWRHFSTAIGDALELSEALFEEVPDCKRFVVDVSGDGYSNEGPSPAPIRDRLAAKGIVINGLAIEGSAFELTEYYKANVQAGHGSFVYTAEGYEDYPRAIRRKIMDEITEPVS